MRDDLRFVRQLERDILTAIAEDCCDQFDLIGMIDDLETTYAEIVARLRRRQIAQQQERLIVESTYIVVPQLTGEKHPIESEFMR